MADLGRASVRSVDWFASVDVRPGALLVAGGKRMRNLGMYPRLGLRHACDYGHGLDSQVECAMGWGRRCVDGRTNYSM